MLDRRAFWFLRHGETDWNTQSLAQGRTEVALNARGMAQAHAAAALLRHRGIRTIVTSPLTRAHITAAIAGQALGLPVAVDAELIECNYGDHEGKPMTQWFDDWVHGSFTPQGAESFIALRVRAERVLNRCLALEAPVLVVAHGGLMRATRAIMGLEPLYRTPNAVPLFCEPPAQDGQPWTLTAAETPAG